MERKKITKKWKKNKKNGQKVKMERKKIKKTWKTKMERKKQKWKAKQMQRQT